MHPGKGQACVTAMLPEAIARRQSGQPAWRWYDHRVRGRMEATSGIPGGPMPPARMVEGCFWGYNVAAILTEAIAQVLTTSAYARLNHHAQQENDYVHAK